MNTEQAKHLIEIDLPNYLEAGLIHFRFQVGQTPTDNKYFYFFPFAKLICDSSGHSIRMTGTQTQIFFILLNESQKKKEDKYLTAQELDNIIHAYDLESSATNINDDALGFRVFYSGFRKTIRQLLPDLSPIFPNRKSVKTGYHLNICNLEMHLPPSWMRQPVPYLGIPF